MEPANINDDVISPEPICMNHELPPRPSVLPVIPSHFVAQTIFPFPEGHQFEFKEMEHVLSAEKLYETVCAFLNSAGGYIIVGIHDNGTIIGIDRKDCDKLLLRADSTIHTRRVVERDTGRTLCRHELCGYTVRVEKTDDKFLVILRVVNPDHNQAYRMANGELLIRLSASNYRTRSTTLVPYDELLRENEMLNSNYSSAVGDLARYKHQYNRLERSYRELLRRLSVTETNAALYDKILTDKAYAERRISSRNWLTATTETDVFHILF